MKRLLSTLLTAIAMAVLAACSTPTELVDSCTLENDLALQTGNWWVYDVYNTDIDNNKITGSERQDSTVVQQTELYNGKTAYRLISYSSADGGITYTLSDTVWIAIENGQAYIPMWKLVQKPCPCFAMDWAKVADCTGNNWTAFETSNTESVAVVRRNNDGDEEIVSGQSQINFQTHVTRETSTVTIGNRSVSAQEFRVLHKVVYTLLSPADAVYLMTGGRVATYFEETRFVLGEHMGIVEMSRTTQWFVDADGVKKPVDGTVKGIVKNLVRYSVK
jgi:hypothetical protein